MINASFTEILLAGLAAILVVAAVIDVRTFTISNRLNLTVALLAPVYWASVALSPWPGIAIQLAAAVTVFAILAGAFYAGMMGGGDVKLAAALALWFSPVNTIKFLVIMSLAGGILTLGMLALAPRQTAARDAPKFRTESRSHSAVSQFSPNGFLTNLSDV